MRCVFVGTPGFLGRIDSETRCAFWAEESVDHGFDPTRLIDVDFARTPSAAAAREIAWDAVQVDDRFAGPNGVLSGTTLGPRWPELRLTGAVYLERGFVASLMSGQSYECVTAYPPGRSQQPTVRPVTMWIDSRCFSSAGSFRMHARHTPRNTHERQGTTTSSSGRRADDRSCAGGSGRHVHRRTVGRSHWCANRAGISHNARRRRM